MAAALASFVPRVVVRSREVYSIDSALLALGVRSYDFDAYHPHPPYYPLSIAAAKAVAAVARVDEVDAVTWVSLGSVAVLALCVFGIGRALGGRAVGLVAAGLLALSPLVTENAAVPLTYTSEAAASALVGWLALRAHWRRTTLAWVLLGIGASIAVGLRPSAALTAAPLILWACRRDLAALARTALAGAAATSAWLVPAVAAGGGWSAFRYGNDYQTRFFLLHDPAWSGGSQAIANNLAWLAYHVRHELLALAVLGSLWLVTCCAPRSGGLHRGFLWTWVLPPLAFYGLVYAGWPIFPSGYVMAVVPPAAVAAALVVRRLWCIVRDPLLPRPLGHMATAVVIAAALLPLSWLPTWDSGLEARDDAEAWARSWDGLEDVLPSNRTALLAGYSGQWTILEHPQYLIWIVEGSLDETGMLHLQIQQWAGRQPDKSYFENVRDGAPDQPHPIPSWVQEIAIVQGHPMESGRSTVPPTRQVALPGGAVVDVYAVEGLATIEDAIPGLADGMPIPRLIWPPD